MRANATLIGAFVLGAIVLLAAGILFFGSGTLLQQLPSAAYQWVR